MKINFSYSSSRILKKNFPFVLSLVSLCFISMFVIYLNIWQYSENSVKIAALDSEIADYNKKKLLLDFKNQVVDTEIDLDSANQALAQLIPAEEDYFSVLAALEKLSTQSKFIITYYNIIISKSTANKLAIMIEGEGNPNTFLEFLKEYNFAGGRLVTIDRIDFSQKAFTGAKVNLSVYSGKVGLSQVSASSGSVDLSLIKQILDKVQIQIKSDTSIVEDYATKSNPF